MAISDSTAQDAFDALETIAIAGPGEHLLSRATDIERGFENASVRYSQAQMRSKAIAKEALDDIWDEYVLWRRIVVSFYAQVDGAENINLPYERDAATWSMHDFLREYPVLRTPMVNGLIDAGWDPDAAISYVGLMCLGGSNG